jgi:hypothetical protein
MFKRDWLEYIDTNAISNGSKKRDDEDAKFGERLTRTHFPFRSPIVFDAGAAMVTFCVYPV